ncbi:hypothetical protein FRC01_009173, partial [Tulasnella sp. 417]
MEPFPHSQTVASQAAAQAAMQRLGLAIGSNANGDSPIVMPDRSTVDSLASGNNRESIKKDPDFWAPETVQAVVFQEMYNLELFHGPFTGIQILSGTF